MQVMQCRYILLGLTLGLTLVGCGTMGNALNPYQSEFSCPLSDKGQCIGVPQAYDKATGKDPELAVNIPRKKAQVLTPADPGTPTQTSTAETAYEQASYQKLAGLLREPVTPVVAPPKVMRVLILPYKSGENDLYMARYAYFIVDDPRWVLGDYLRPSDGE